MEPDVLLPGLRAIAARWWTLLVRGGAAILFGLLAITVPGAGLLAIVTVWGAYALVDGVLSLAMAVRGARERRSWGWFLFEGIVGVLAGVLTFAYPGLTAVVLLAIIAGWAVLTGIAAIGAAVRLRHVIRGEWLLALSGLLSVAFGVLLLLAPRTGAIAVVWTVGVYAIGFGMLLFGLGLRLHRWARGGGAMPTPTPA